jgi:NTE family protein
MSYSPVYAAMDMTSRLMSPYGSGPFYSNALEPIVDQMKYDAICDDTGPELHICMTNLRTGKIKVFTGGDISSASLMASACLPTGLSSGRNRRRSLLGRRIHRQSCAVPVVRE